jgi:tetratricopeptide (TPR) repeat protein
VLDDLIAANVGSSRFNDGERETLRIRVRSLIEDAREGVKERQVPMIFIKLMIERADQLLNESKQLDELPMTLAELVTEYTEQLLRNEQDLTLAVQQARTAAHVCMGKERIPKSRSETRYTFAGVSKEILQKFVTAGLILRSGEKSDPFYKYALDPLAEQLDAIRVVIGIRDGPADQTELDGLIQQWEELPEDFVSALRRAATNYRDSIYATQPAFALKLWPHAEQAAAMSLPLTTEQKTVLCEVLEVLGARGEMLQRIWLWQEALESYMEGAYLEGMFALPSTYNRLNVVNCLLLAGMKRLRECEPQIRELAALIEMNLRANESLSDSCGAWADLGDCMALLGNPEEARRAYSTFIAKAEIKSPERKLDVMKDIASKLKELADPDAPRVQTAIDVLGRVWPITIPVEDLD